MDLIGSDVPLEKIAEGAGKHPQEVEAELFAAKEKLQRADTEALRAAVARTLAGIGGKARGVAVDFVTDVDQIADPSLREKARAAQNGGGRVQAIYEKATANGGPRLTFVAGEVANPARAVELALHEMVGHHGLGALFAENPAGWQGLTEQLWKQWQQTTFSPEDAAQVGYRSLNELAAQYHNPENGANFHPATAEGRANLIEEHLARLAERGIQPTWWQNVTGKIRDLLRSLSGGRLFQNLSDADVTRLLARARRAAGEGNASVATEQTALFAKEIRQRQDKPASWLEVQPRHAWNSAKQFLPRRNESRPGFFLKKGGTWEEKVAHVAEWLKAVPSKVEDPVGRSCGDS